MESISPNPEESVSLSITELVERNLFNASVMALMGSHFLQDSHTAFDDYATFDQGVIDLLRGVKLPFGRVTRAKAAQERQVSRMTAFIKAYFREGDRGYIEGAEESCMSPTIHALKTGGLTEDEVARMQTAFIWGSMSNKLHVCKWVFYYLLPDPKTFRAVEEEIRKVLSERFQNISALLHADPQNLDRQIFPLLTSAIEESLRLTTFPSSGRVALSDMEIKLNESRSIPIKKGEIVLANTLSMHSSPENFDEPGTFKLDRFATNKTESRSQTKAFLPFGSGPHKCPGRYYALHSIRMFVILCFYFYDLRLSPDSTNTSVPTIDPASFINIARPKEDIRVTVRRRR